MVNPLPKSAEFILWGAPAIGIPVLRYLQDNRQQRKELFLRDVSTYTVGAGLYGVTRYLAAPKLFKALQIFKQPKNLNFASFIAGMTVNILYAGIGAVKLSRHFGQRYFTGGTPQSAPQVRKTTSPQGDTIEVFGGQATASRNSNPDTLAPANAVQNAPPLSQQVVRGYYHV